jgi:hypothetical protein
MEDKINKNIDFCGNCNGVLCKDCKKDHNPKHGLRIRKYIFVEPKLKNEDENKKKCITCRKKIIISNDSNYCNQCNGELCDSCNYNHNKEYPAHKLIIRKYLAEKIKEPDDDEQNKKVVYKDEDNANINNKNYSYQFPNNKCMSCKEDLSLLDENSTINQCCDCKGNLCLKCSKNHNKVIN